MSHNRTHHERLARRLSLAVPGLGYQQALNLVRQAAEAALLPQVLDDAGMTVALATLLDQTQLNPQKTEADGVALDRHVDRYVRSVELDPGDGLPRHTRPGPHPQVNAALLRAGVAMPSTVDYRPDGFYRVWGDRSPGDHGVMMMVREWPQDSARWTVSIHDANGDSYGVGDLAVDEATAAMISAAKGKLTRRGLKGMQPREPHRCDQRCQRYQLIGRAWCITQARELIETDPTAAQYVEEMIITSLDEDLGLVPVEPGTGRFQLFPVDTEAAKTADLSVPLIAIRLLDEDNRHASDLIIDGWERAYRARTEGRTFLPAYMLSDTAERTARRGS